MCPGATCLHEGDSGCGDLPTGTSAVQQGKRKGGGAFSGTQYQTKEYLYTDTPAQQHCPVLGLLFQFPHSVAGAHLGHDAFNIQKAPTEMRIPCEFDIVVAAKQEEIHSLLLP